MTDQIFGDNFEEQSQLEFPENNFCNGDSTQNIWSTISSSYQSARDAGIAVGKQVAESATTVLKLATDSGKFLDFSAIDKLMEVLPKDKPAEKKQEWTVAMYIATDFGNECTIEKRTKKLQELAEQTVDKPVTIVVQTANKDKDGKYQIERFALKDGKVQKLESPGETKGYGGDIEGLLQFATKNYKSKNLVLTLDSHGGGNSGLQGDIGNLSLDGLNKAVKNGLKGSGHEKLDLLQFDACLMAQNGVLESTTAITRHLVASAEPEGTGAGARDADNRQLTELLKKPSMSAAELADIFVGQSKDNVDFKTLAHFDLEQYEAFRNSLDDFGEKMAKLCEDPENLKVIREIIKETFSYGKSKLGIGVPTITLPGFGGLSSIPGLQQFFRPGMMPQPGKFSSEEVGSEGGLGLLLGAAPRAFWGNLLNPERNKRDLKDFVARVLLAISKGRLKDDEAGSLNKAAKSVLVEGTKLTKSFYGRDERKDLGGLSAFLPAEPNDSEEQLSTKGGWRKFQQHLRKDKPK